MLPVQVNHHLEKYWSLSARLFQDAEFALATFFAITLIEEVGKVIILYNQ
jgi:AbiV family abortive infection protein